MLNAHLSSTSAFNHWQPIKLGGAGAVFQLDHALSDGTSIVGSDQYGCYLLPGGTDTWINVATATRCPAVIDSNGVGLAPTCVMTAIDPSNTQNIWMALYLGHANGTPSIKLFKSTNQGGTFAAVSGYPDYAFSPYLAASNKSHVPAIAVDPANSNIVYASTPQQGLYRTTDGNTFSVVQGVGAGLMARSSGTAQAVPTKGTDTTSISTFTGTVAFNNNSGSFAFAVGNLVSVWQTSNKKNVLYGTVSASSGTTFSLDVIFSDCTGTIADWTVGTSYGTAAAVSLCGGGHIIAFDPTSAVVGGVTQGIYVSTYGVGTFHSNDGGTTWTAIAGPLLNQQIRVGASGTLWFIQHFDNSTKSLWKYVPGSISPWTAGSWTQSTNSITSAATFDVDMNHSATDAATHIILLASNTYNYTTDGGSTWKLLANPHLVSAAAADQPGWIVNLWNGGFGFFPGGTKFASNGDIYMAAEGTWYFTPSTSATDITFNAYMKGQEMAESWQIVANQAKANSVVFGSFDFGTVYTESLSTYPTSLSGINPHTNSLKNVYALDFARASGTADMVVIGDNTVSSIAGYLGFSGISFTGGKVGSFSALTLPVKGDGTHYTGGNICMSTANEMMYLPVDGSSGAVFPYYTTDGGATWTQITVSGATVTGGWPYFRNNYVTQGAADPTTPGKYYLYNWNIGGAPTGDAIITCTTSDGVMSCSYTSKPTFSAGGGSTQFNGRLKVAPNGDVWFSPGYQASEPRSNFFYYSTNGGTTFGTVTGFKNVTAYGFGATFPGQAYAGLAAVGWYTGTVVIDGVSQSVTSRYGIYMCRDFNTATGSGTWRAIGDQYPLGWAAPITDMDGDKFVPGQFYMSTNLGGGFYGQFN